MDGRDAMFGRDEQTKSRDGLQVQSLKGCQITEGTQTDRHYTPLYTFDRLKQPLWKEQPPTPSPPPSWPPSSVANYTAAVLCAASAQGQ
eukprot:scaffold27515_cov42-Phaeocystis_antarctica.AAC.2